MQPRTRRQKEVLDIILKYSEKNGHLPSYQVIARRLGLAAKSGVARHVEALEAQGLIRRRFDGGRFKLELCGGEVYESETKVVEWFSAEYGADGLDGRPFAVPNFLLGMYANSDIFAFRVSDDAMSERNICEGDIALVERRSFVREGSLVVASIKDESFLRLYYRNGSRIELRGASEDCEMIAAAADEVALSGIFRALIRPAE